MTENKCIWKQAILSFSIYTVGWAVSELDVDRIHPWIGLDWIWLDDYHPPILNVLLHHR